MEVFEDYLIAIAEESHRLKIREVLLWVEERFPGLSGKIAWNQPMFTDHGTFIIGFGVSKQHFGVSPESQSIAAFQDRIAKAGYTQGSNLFRIKWTDPIDYKLLEDIILYNIEEKKDCTAFWRKG